MVAKYNYTRVVDTHELSLSLGEILLVENDFGGGWFWLQSQTSGQSGWVHEILVDPFVSLLIESSHSGCSFVERMLTIFLSKEEGGSSNY